MEVFRFAWSGRVWIDMAFYVDALASGVCASMGDHRRPGHFPAVRFTGGAGGYLRGRTAKASSSNSRKMSLASVVTGGVRVVESPSETRPKAAIKCARKRCVGRRGAPRSGRAGACGRQLADRGRRRLNGLCGLMFCDRCRPCVFGGRKCGRGVGVFHTVKVKATGTSQGADTVAGRVQGGTTEGSGPIPAGRMECYAGVHTTARLQFDVVAVAGCIG